MDIISYNEASTANDRIDTLDATAVKLIGNQTIAGIKTFSSTIVGNISGNAGTATKLQTARTINGVAFDGSANIAVSDATAVNLTADQTIEDVKTFTSSPIVPTPTADTQAANKAYADTKQANLGFTPVQQGTGIGQSSNVVKIGWSGSRTKITIDATDMGNIVMDSDIGVANSSLVKTALNASGTAPIYACRAWVNFNGTETVAIRASGNVSSITDNEVGDYTVNFTTAMSDAAYALSGISMVNSMQTGVQISEIGGISTTSARVFCHLHGLGNVDSGMVAISIFR